MLDVRLATVKAGARKAPIKLYTPAEHPGEVAEWLKALAC
jgi:hypothetical protein